MGDRWETYGIMNLVDGRGDPLFRHEPDNTTEAGQPVNWSGDGEELLFLYTSPEVFGFYDARGRKVVVPSCEGLPSMRRHITRRYSVSIEDLTGDARDEIVYIHEGAIYIVTQDRPYPAGERIYAPTRKMDISIPGWKVNEA